MKSKLKKWIHDIKCGFREDNKICMRYKAYGVLMSLFGFFMLVIIAFTAFWCGRNSSERKSNVVTASAETSSFPVELPREDSIDIKGFEHSFYYMQNGDVYYGISTISFNYARLGVPLSSPYIGVGDRSYNLPTDYETHLTVPCVTQILPLTTDSSNVVIGSFDVYMNYFPSNFVDWETFLNTNIFVRYRLGWDDITRKRTSLQLFFLDKETFSVESKVTVIFNLQLNQSFSISQTLNSEVYSTFLYYYSYPTYEYAYYYYLQDESYRNVIYNKGYDEGYDDGYDLGLERGQDVGYDEGYQDGLDKAERGTFANAVSTVLGAPVTVVSQFLDFDILGFNMLAFVAGLITLMIIIKLLRLFI